MVRRESSSFSWEEWLNTQLHEQWLIAYNNHAFVIRAASPFLFTIFFLFFPFNFSIKRKKVSRHGMLVVGRIVRGCVRRNVRQRTERSESSLPPKWKFNARTSKCTKRTAASYQLKPKSNFFQALIFTILFDFLNYYKNFWKNLKKELEKPCSDICINCSCGGGAMWRWIGTTARRLHHHHPQQDHRAINSSNELHEKLPI